MKTFDEALKTVVGDRLDLLSANLLADKDNQMENALFVECIVTVEKAWRSLVPKCKDSTDLVAANCSCLHTAFQLGVLVGMEMEREVQHDQ